MYQLLYFAGPGAGADHPEVVTAPETSLALAADLAVAPGPGPGPDQEEDLALDLEKLKHHDMND